MPNKVPRRRPPKRRRSTKRKAKEPGAPRTSKVIPFPVRPNDAGGLLAAGNAGLRNLADDTCERAQEIFATLPPLPRERRVLVEHAWQVIDDMFVVMADLLKPDLSPEQTAALREHVQHCYMRRFLLDADSERHARVALLGLIDAAVTVTMTSGKPDVPPSTDWASATIERWVDWTLVRYAEDFPRFAEKLATAQKRGALRAVLSAWWLAKTGGNPPASTWKLLAELGKGVFATSNPEDWEKNVWSRKMRALVAIDDDE